LAVDCLWNCAVAEVVALDSCAETEGALARASLTAVVALPEARPPSPMPLPCVKRSRRARVLVAVTSRHTARRQTRLETLTILQAGPEDTAKQSRTARQTITLVSESSLTLQKPGCTIRWVHAGYCAFDRPHVDLFEKQVLLQN
jgi:hypothetical protein